jgi:hypothetical protein
MWIKTKNVNKVQHMRRCDCNLPLMDFLSLQRGLESRPCREILYIRFMHIMRLLFCVLYVNPLEKSPPPPLHATDNILLQVFFKDTLYFLLKYVLLPVLFTLTQVVLLLITSTFTRVQFQSNFPYENLRTA